VKARNGPILESGWLYARMCAGLCPTYATAVDAAEENRNGSRLSCSRRNPLNWYYGTQFLAHPVETRERLVHTDALLRYRSKTANMQKFPIDSHSNKNFISPFFRPPGAANPKRGEDTFGTTVRPHAKFGVNWPAGCREIVDKKTKTAKVKQIPRRLSL